MENDTSTGSRISVFSPSSKCGHIVGDIAHSSAGHGTGGRCAAAGALKPSPWRKKAPRRYTSRSLVLSEIAASRVVARPRRPRVMCWAVVGQSESH